MNHSCKKLSKGHAMDKKNCHIEIKKGLNEELIHSRSLLAILREESTVSHKNTEKLLALSEQKNSLLMQLDQLHCNRNSILESFGFNPDNQGMESCISWCDHNLQLKKQWQAFLQIVTDCRNVNQLNGSIMDSSLRTVKQALAILYGQQLNENTYNAHGQEQNSGMGRSIAKA